MAPKYKIIYFNGRGRAEVSRLLFAAAGVEYEDERIDYVKDWATLKTKMPQETVPVLVIDGKVTVGQSLAIARYLARQFNFYGQTPLESLYVDQFVDTTLDLLIKFEHSYFEPDETQKKDMMTKFLSETMPKFLGLLQKLADSFGSAGFAVGSSHTLADFYLMTVTETLKCTDELERFPKLAAVVRNLRQHPGVAKHVQNRPETSF